MTRENLLDALSEEITACRRCPRLVAWREEVAQTKRRAYRDEIYWGKPVPGFGDFQARVVAVGLAPGAHGSNRTGRQFTGDASGAFLYPALFRAGFASQPKSHSREDSLRLKNLWITSAVRCAPPKNRPSAEELTRCLPFLARELEILHPSVIVALGKIAFEQILRLNALRRASYPFSHGATYKLPSGVWLLASYHPSRQNTQTGRLTIEMFNSIWEKAKRLAEEENAPSALKTPDA